MSEFTATADSQEVWAVLQEFKLSMRELAIEVVLLRKLAKHLNAEPVQLSDTPSAGVGVSSPAVLLEPLPLEDVPPYVIAEAEARVNLLDSLPIEELPRKVNSDPELQDKLEQSKDEVPF
jgi:hypothetical protein